MSSPAIVPTTFVIFGATGDLIEKKIVPALFRLHKHKKLPKLFQVIGISRRELTEEAFQSQVLEILKKTPEATDDEPEMEAFASLFHYISGEFANKSTYEKVAASLGIVDKKWMKCTNKLYYLAVPPVHYDSIIKNLSDVGLNTPCGDNKEGYTRIVVEKPFGHDTGSANKLQELLTSCFTEDQIYRLDHYLGKRMIENLMAFRFGNNFFDGAWSNKYIEKIEIKLLETNDATGRGPFYDSVGALRDVGQNHLLSFLALVAMNNPGLLSSHAVRMSRSKILEKLVVPTNEQIVKQSVRGQYEGYRETEGVAVGSQKETYFKLICYLDHPMWRGVPFILEAGKSLKTSKKEVVITFRKPISSLPMKKLDADGRNKMLFKLEPEESIQLDLWAKQNGYEMVLEDKRFLLNERNAAKRVQYTEEYEKLLLDVFSGNQTFFVSSEEVAAQWRFIDPIVCAFDSDLVRLTPYAAHSDSIRDYAKEYLNTESIAQKNVSEVGIVGLGKMGSNLARHLLSEGYSVVGFNRSKDVTDLLSKDGLVPTYSIKEMVSKLKKPRVVWLMLPHGAATDQVISELSTSLETGDIVIDGGNSHFEEAQKHMEILKSKQIEFVDVGVSGGPMGALLGACLMVGGNQKMFDHLFSLYKDVSVPGGVSHFEGVGAGHFVKMVHNGIEYGMMQSLAEGFNMLGKSPYVINLNEAASVFSHGSVIESKLVSWLHNAFVEYGPELTEVKGSVDSNGEGDWSVEFAEKMGLTNWTMKAAVDFRKQSQQNPDFTGKILSAIRGQFGGHETKEVKEK